MIASAASRGVFAIEEEELLLPDPIALDTSFVVEALIAMQPLHVVCRAFLDRFDARGVSITTSDLLSVELAEARRRSGFVSGFARSSRS